MVSGTEENCKSYIFNCIFSLKIDLFAETEVLLLKLVIN